MKRIIFLFILFSSFCYGQDYYNPPSRFRSTTYTRIKDTTNKKSFFFSFNFGLSLPVRDYGSRDTSHNFMVFYARPSYIYNPDTIHGKGYAKMGFHADISGGAFLAPDFGLSARISYNDNSFDESTLNSQMIPSYFSYNVSADFQVLQFMAGGFGDLKISHSSWLRAQFMLGLIHASFPAIQMNYSNLQINETLPYANDFAYYLSLAYEKQFADNINFVATLSYTGANLIYSSVTYVLSYTVPGIPTPPAYVQNTPVTMSFGSVDFSVGLLFHF